MTGRTHDLVAVTALSVVVLSQPPRTVTLATAIVAVLANLIGGIAPDVDQPTAPFWRNLPVGRYFGRVFAAVQGGHRFLTHSLLGLAIAGFAVHWLLVWLHPIMTQIDIGLVWWAFMIGMISHLVMDTFTKEGVPWLLPLPLKFGIPPLKRLRVTTDKAAENLLIFPGLLALNCWLYFMNYGKILDILRYHLFRLQCTIRKRYTVGSYMLEVSYFNGLRMAWQGYLNWIVGVINAFVWFLVTYIQFA